MLSAEKDQLLQLVPVLPLRGETIDFLIDKEAQGLGKRTIHLYRVELGYFSNYLQAQGIRTPS